MRLDNNLQYFLFFYGYLKYRVFVVFILSLLVGLIDGIGLALFIPLLQLVSQDQAPAGQDDGLITGFVTDFLQIQPTLMNILLLIFFFFLLKGILKMAEGYFRVVYQQLFMRKINISNINLLNNYSFQHFAKADAGRIQNTFSGEVARVNTAFRLYFKAFQYAVLVGVYVIMAMMANPQFALMVALGGLATNFLFRFLYKRTKYFSRKLTQKFHVFQNLLLQKVAMFKYLKTTGSQLFYSKKLKNTIFELEKIQRRLGLVDSLLNSLREPIIIFIVIVAIFLQVEYFGEDLALIILSLLLLYRALTFFMAMQEQWNFFLGVSGSLENMKAFSQELEKGKEANGNLPFTGLKNKLELNNIGFGYESNKVLKDINLDIFKNETLAIVGESGSGKSTLMNVISGLVLPSVGTYCIDGTPISELELNSFRKYMGYIAQDPPVFNDTLYNNVTFWAENNRENQQRFQDAIKKAALWDYVAALPKKGETLLGFNGINLSGGQKQRLSIARELYKSVEFLLMDEATSALDGETEAIIQQNIEKLKGRFTMIVIAHRLATIKNADRIVLLDKGSIENIGSYTELIENSAHFREMIRLQNL